MKFFITSILIFIISFHIFSFQNILSQSKDTIGIADSIIIIGNQKTKPFVILREIKISPGDTITQSLIDESKNRLYNLQLFNSIDIFTYPKNSNHYDVIIQVSERWFIYPVPIFGIKDHNWKKFYYGLGLLNINFRGANEKIFISGNLGYEPLFQVNYKTPNIDFFKNGFMGISLSLQKMENRSLSIPDISKNFYIKNYNLYLTLGKRIDLNQDLWINLGYQFYSVDKEFSLATLNQTGKDHSPILGVGYKYDSRDLNDFTMSGTFLNIQINKYGIFQKNINYTKNYFDYRRFIPIIKNLTFAFRNYIGLSYGKKIPTYNLSYIGYSEKIRGHFSEVYEAENILKTSAELRFFLLEPKIINIDYIPLPEFSVGKFGLAGVIFGDAGKIWYRHEPFQWQNFIKGYGIGLNIILPYHFVFRIEYAINELRKGEFIFDLYSSF